MSAGHAHRLYLPGGGTVHRLAPQCKLVATGCFVLAVVLTPREQFWAFGVHALLLAAVAAVARVPAGVVLRRMMIELPFVLFAVLLPFVATGPRVTVFGVGLSLDGLYGAWGILAKGSLGVAASILLAATTDLRRILLGLQRLRMPALLVQIMTFMLRYGDVIAEEMHRMRIARESRGFDARDVRQFPAVARSAGALFVRSYERGERVHLAMLARGYDGAMPVLDGAGATRREWLTALALPAAGALVALGAIATSAAS